MNSEKERRRITALEMSDEFFFSSIESNRLKINRRLIKRLEKESSEKRSKKDRKKIFKILENVEKKSKQTISRTLSTNIFRTKY